MIFFFRTTHIYQKEKKQEGIKLFCAVYQKITSSTTKLNSTCMINGQIMMKDQCISDKEIMEKAIKEARSWENAQVSVPTTPLMRLPPKPRSIKSSGHLFKPRYIKNQFKQQQQLIYTIGYFDNFQKFKFKFICNEHIFILKR